MMTGVRETFPLLLLLLAVGCSKQTEQASPEAKAPQQENTGSVELYDVSLNADVVKPGQQVSFCFKAKNAISVYGFPGKFFKNGSLDGDCLVDTPKGDTLYRVEVVGSDGVRKVQSTMVKVRP